MCHYSTEARNPGNPGPSTGQIEGQMNFIIFSEKTLGVKNTETKPLNLKNGLLITFEGIDGSGKTSMARRATVSLQQAGYKAEYLREPTDGPYGRRLRELMLSPETRDPKQEFELFLLDRQDDVRLNIQPLLEAGGIICIDRYYVSSMAYQGALGLDPLFIRQENEKFAPPPDLILWYSIPIDAALQRIRASRPDGANFFEQKNYLEKVDSLFGQMDFPQMIKINAMQPQEKVFLDTWEIITSHLSNFGTQNQ